MTQRICIANGAVQQSNFFDYHVPGMGDMPQMPIKLVQTKTGVRLRQQRMLAVR